MRQAGCVGRLLYESCFYSLILTPKGGLTALQEACSNGHLDVAQLLIDSGAQVDEAGWVCW